MIKNLINKIFKDHCVICKKITSYGKMDHVNKRQYYIDGAGQLCSKCYNRLYKI
jgi:hypothetical protein